MHISYYNAQHKPLRGMREIQKSSREESAQTVGSWLTAGGKSPCSSAGFKSFALTDITETTAFLLELHSSML